MVWAGAPLRLPMKEERKDFQFFNKALKTANKPEYICRTE